MSKCLSCNVIINELLAFVQNKIEIMDDESLVLICSRSFKAPEILAAKVLLYDVIATDKRLKTRRNEGKSQRDMEDIVGLMKITDPNEIPIFVARELTKLPPVTFDHIDVTRLLKDIVALKADVANLHHNSATKDQLDVVQQEVSMLRESTRLPSGLTGVINGARIMEDSGPIGRDEFSTLPDNNTTITPSIETQTIPATSTEINNMAVHVDPIIYPTTFAQSVKRNAVTKTTKIVDADGFQLVDRKKHRRKSRNIIGNATNTDSSKIKSAPRTAFIYVANLDNCVTTQDLAGYMQDLNEPAINVEKLPDNKKVTYNEFKITIPWDRLPSVIKKESWPPGVIVGRYHEKNARKSIKRNNTA